jgi:hypothetical protein
MADKTSYSNTLSFEWLFTDGDTRTQKVKNPQATIEATQVSALNDLILNGGDSSPTLLIGDKTGAPFRRINKVTKVQQSITTLDLS